jgi:ubiquinone biosynthesis protein COQ9
MLNSTTKHDTIIRAAMKLAETRGWRTITLADIAAEADVSLSAVYRRFKTKSKILEAFIEAVDEAVLKQSKKPDLNAPARDRVFEVVMTRLDVLKPYKPALARIRQEARCSLPGPDTIRLFCASANSQKWMLAAAGIPADGGKGCVRVSGMACIYARVVPVWLKDDDPDLSRTMAVLDRELRDGERWLKRIDAIVGDLCRIACRFVPRRRRDGDAPEHGAAPEPPPSPQAGTGPMAEQPGGA